MAYLYRCQEGIIDIVTSVRVYKSLRIGSPVLSALAVHFHLTPALVVHTNEVNIFDAVQLSIICFFDAENAYNEDVSVFVRNGYTFLVDPCQI